MLFGKKVVSNYMDFVVVFYYERRSNWLYTITELSSRTIENAIAETRATLEYREDYKLAEIYKKKDRFGTSELFSDNLLRLFAIYKEDISFGLALFDPDEVGPEGTFKRDTPFIIKKNYLAEFRTSGYKDIKIDVHRHEIYADTLEECISKAKQKLWEVFCFRYSCIYAARADKFRGELIKIIGKVNDTYELATFELKSDRGFDDSNEFNIQTKIYEFVTPEIKHEDEFVKVSRPVERYSQALARDRGDIKEVADCDKEGFLAVSINSNIYGVEKRFYVRSDMLAELKKSLKTDNLENNSVVYWHDHENVVYRIFPYPLKNPIQNPN